jgi:hypothetical protein
MQIINHANLFPLDNSSFFEIIDRKISIDSPLKLCPEKKKQPKKYSHIKSVERICQKIGLNFHMNNGHLILREFLLFSFPNGLESLITRKQIKYLSLKSLVEYLEKIDKQCSHIFNQTQFKIFLEQKILKCHLLSLPKRSD